MCRAPWLGGLGFTPSEVENMTLYQFRSHVTDWNRGRKLDSTEAMELGKAPKFQAGLEREKKRLAELRKQFTGDGSPPPRWRKESTGRNTPG